MIEAQRLRQTAEYKRAARALENGWIELLDAAKWIDDLWQRGIYTYEEANTVLKLLAKVKTA